MKTWLEAIADYIAGKSTAIFEYRLGKLVVAQNLFLHNSPRDSANEDIVVIESDENHGTSTAGDPRRFPIMAVIVVTPTWEGMTMRLDQLRDILYGEYGELSVFYVPNNENPVAMVKVDSVSEPKRLLDDFGRCKVIQDYNITFVPLT